MSSRSLSHPPRSLPRLRAANPPHSTGEGLLLPAPAAALALAVPAIASFRPRSYDGFPELRPELFESPREQPGALPVPGPARSAPSSPAPRRTKQVTRTWAPHRPLIWAVSSAVRQTQGGCATLSRFQRAWPVKRWRPALPSWPPPSSPRLRRPGPRPRLRARRLCLGPRDRAPGAASILPPSEPRPCLGGGGRVSPTVLRPALAWHGPYRVCPAPSRR